MFKTINSKNDIVEPAVWEKYFICPLCYSSLEFKNNILKCIRCLREYPILYGIPDFRVSSDQKADNSLNRKEEEKMLNLVLQYYVFAKDYRELVRVTSEKVLQEDELLNINQRRKKYRIWCREEALKHFETSGEILYNKFYQQLVSKTNYKIKNRSVLDFGCGTGLDILGLKKYFEIVFAMDISFSQLLYVKKLCESYELDNVIIFCANGEHLPLRDKIIDYVQSNNVIEHIKKQKLYINEMSRVLDNEGFGFIASPNRYSLLKERHTHIYIIGFIPRKFMDRCAKFLTGTSMKGTRLLSYFDIKKIIGSNNSELVSIFYIPKGLKLTFYNDFKRRLIIAVLNTPILGRVLNFIFQRKIFIFFSPIHHIILKKTKNS